MNFWFFLKYIFPALSLKSQGGRTVQEGNEFVPSFMSPSTSPSQENLSLSLRKDLLDKGRTNQKPAEHVFTKSKEHSKAEGPGASLKGLALTTSGQSQGNSENLVIDSIHIDFSVNKSMSLHWYKEINRERKGVEGRKLFLTKEILGNKW